MVNKLILYAGGIYDFEKKEIIIGGLQTYIIDLALLGVKAGYNTIYYQLNETKNSSRSDTYKSIIIKEVYYKKSFLKSAVQKGFDEIYKKENTKNTIFITGSDQFSIKNKSENIITIQHGIAFDIPGNLIKGIWGKNKTLQIINKTLRCINNVRRYYYIKNMVCVDYNYYNWFRTIGTVYADRRIIVIPNFASKCISDEELINKLSRLRNQKKIVFSRRFVDYRGTLIFANVIKMILKEREDIDVTFAGNGPLKKTIENMFSSNSHIHFTEYQSDKSVDFHKEFDIAVVPTIYSEGTSLSLAEAMAAGCLPLATHVGGMTNMILDGFNGYLTYPDEASLYSKLNMILDLDTKEFNNIVKRSFESAQIVFSKERWEKSWTNVFNIVSSINTNNND